MIRISGKGESGKQESKKKNDKQIQNPWPENLLFLQKRTNPVNKDHFSPSTQFCADRGPCVSDFFQKQVSF